MSSTTQSSGPSSGGFQISSWSIRNPIPTIVFFLVMTIVGVLGFNSLRINNWPDIDFPIVVVTVVRSGAAPEELQNQVTRIVEDSVAGLSGVRHTQSYVNEGASTTVITFQLDTDLEKDTNDVRNAVAGIRGNLPSDITDPIVSRVENASGQSLLSYIIRADNMNPEELSWYVDNDIAKKVHAVKGVSGITRDGGVDREIRVELDPGKLAAQGATAADISGQLRSFNVNMPGGSFDSGTSEQTIRTMGNANSIAELSDKRITLSNGGSVRLGDIATVTDTWSRPTARARFNGNEVVGFGVERARGTSEVRVAGDVRKVIEELKQNPHIQIEQVASSVDDVQRSFDSSMESLIIGALLAVFVVWLFLRDWRATFVSAIAMPMSLLPTFFIMHAFNQSLNVVTLLALSLTVGILVDDAIVEIENIVRHIREGKKPYQAAIEAADEIGLAVVATTATLIAVFAPTGFMPGIVGQFFKSFAVASCVSVFFSLVVARTLTPLMGAYLLRDKGAHDDKPFWMDGYQRMLDWCLSARLKLRWHLLAHGFVIAGVFILMAIKKTSVAEAMPQLVIAAVVFGVFAVLAVLMWQAYVKTRWVVLEIGLVLTLLVAAGAIALMAMPYLAAMGQTAQATVGQSKAAVQAAMKVAMAAAAKAPNPTFGPGVVVFLLAVGLLVGTIWLTIKLKTSYLLARWSVVFGGIIFFVGSIALMTTIPQESIPADDAGMSVMQVSLPPGTTLEETDIVVRRIINDLKTHKEVRSTYASEKVGSATIVANLVPKHTPWFQTDANGKSSFHPFPPPGRKLTQAQFEQEFSKTLKTYPGVRASFGQQGGGGTGVAYILASDDGELLNRTAVELQRQMASLSELANVQSADNLTRPEIQVRPKADEAALMGVSTVAISQAARVATVGDIDQVLAKYNDGDRQIPIRVLLPFEARQDVSTLSNLMVPTKYGTSVPLSAVADISYGAGPIQINRIDRTRVATLSADLNGVPQGVADAAVAKLPIMVKIKNGDIPGVHTIVNPNTEDFIEMVPNFGIAIATGILLMYVVLVLLFGSFSHPFTVLMALPVSFGGAFIGLILCKMSISMPSLIGLIMLTGIAAKNSILLVEYAMVAMKGGMSRIQALEQAARKRARPIVMTTVAMGAGMIPVTIGDDSFRQPMAIAVIGGLITSTLLSLLFIPVMYTIVDQVSNFFGKMISPYFHAQGKDEPEETTAE